MPHSTVSSRGQVTIPKSIRERLGIEPGIQLIFRLEGKKRMVVEIARAPEAAPSLAGALHHLAKEQPVSVAKMSQTIRGRAADRYLRATQRG